MMSDFHQAELHPGWVTALWPSLPEREAGILLGCSRLQLRLQALTASRFDAVDPESGNPEAEDSEDAHALLVRSQGAAIDAAAAMGGAVWHAASIRQIIAAREVERLDTAIGAATRGFALASAALALARPERLETDALLPRIALATTSCRAAWLRGLPPGLRRLALLKLPPGAEAAPVPAASLEGAQRIMAHVAHHLARHHATQGA